MKKVFLLLIVLLIASCTALLATNVKLAWDQSDSPFLDGFQLYTVIMPVVPPSVLPNIVPLVLVGKDEREVELSLDPGEYYFGIKALSFGGLVKSNLSAVLGPIAVLPPPGNFRVVVHQEVSFHIEKNNGTEWVKLGHTERNESVFVIEPLQGAMIYRGVTETK